MEVIFHSIENVLLHISRNFTYPNWGRSHQVRISEVLLYIIIQCLLGNHGSCMGVNCYLLTQIFHQGHNRYSCSPRSCTLLCCCFFFVQNDGITINFCEYECYNGRVLPLLLTGLAFSYLVLLQVIAFVLAVVTRKVKIKVLNDSKEMAIIIYTTSVVLLAQGIVTFGLSSYLVVTETLFNGGVMLATTVVVFFLFVPKVGNWVTHFVSAPEYQDTVQAGI